jgi:tetratricopeptide (TPR) repeat protein
VDGYLRLRAGILKGARSDFEEARSLMPHSPDPHLGLANIYMTDGDLDKAEDELSKARSNGFQPGRREQKALADGYRKRGEKWIKEGNRAHDIGQMQDALKHADGDLDKAQKLYSAVAPFFDGLKLADAVSGERDNIARTLATAQRASNSKETP